MEQKADLFVKLEDGTVKFFTIEEYKKFFDTAFVNNKDINVLEIHRI